LYYLHSNINGYILQTKEETCEHRIKNAVTSTDKDAQYDASAKRLLGQKHILAHILVKTVKEFTGMNPKDIVPLIEGETCISTIPIEPGLTNTVTENNGERLIGLNGENAEINEGLIRFDIIFLSVCQYKTA